jgi:hypothetical protein
MYVLVCSIAYLAQAMDEHSPRQAVAGLPLVQFLPGRAAQVRVADPVQGEQKIGVSSVRRSMGVSATACPPSRESAGYGLLVSNRGDRWWYWLSVEDHEYREADDRNHQS